ncbi:sensor histidine kinase [Streptomyces sp. NPDC054784]
MNDTVRKTAGELAALRREMITDALRSRPLPPLPPLPRDYLPAHVSDRSGQALRWLPHGLFGLVAALVFWQSWSVYGVEQGGNDGASQAGIFLGVALTGSLVLVLFRPMAAWWLSLAVIPAAAVLDDRADGWPFAGPLFFSHLTVMALVTLRTRPVVAVVMWLATLGMGNLILLNAHREPYMTENVAEFSARSAIVLTCVMLLRAYLDARGSAAASRTETLAEQSRRTELEERTTIARELHDVVAHHMSVIAIQAEAAPYRVAHTPPELAASFVTIRENAVAALTELRRVLGVIRVPDDEDAGAPEAPQPTLDDLGPLLDNVRHAGQPVELVRVGAPRELPQGVELSAYRIVQEALSNALRHAPGADTRVELAYVPGGLAVRIVNGPVAAPGARTAGNAPVGIGNGHGITGMRERVAMLDGELAVGPADDGGYAVDVWLPAPARVADGHPGAGRERAAARPDTGAEETA